MLPSVGRQCTSLVRDRTRRRAGSLDGTFHFYLSRREGHVAVVKTAKGERSRAVKGIDLLTSCVRRTRIDVVASCNVFIPVERSDVFRSCVNRRVSIFGVGDATLSTRKLTCPLSMFAG